MDQVAVEEPLQLRLRHGTEGTEEDLGVTMRTPGHDEELAAGLLLGEGIVRRPADIVGFAAGRDRDGQPDPNVLVVRLAPGVAFDPEAHRRATVRSSACGVCGRASLDALAARDPPRFNPRMPRVAPSVLRALPDDVREAQRVFEATGGLHAAALFDVGGSLHGVREDVGRHNAVDKLVGAAFLAGRTPLFERGLFVSGRAGYEILQKALMGGLPFVAAVGAPSSLAVELAEEFGQTLVGFLKRTSLNVYTGRQRVGPGGRAQSPTRMHK